jgi:hypothetical protein
MNSIGCAPQFTRFFAWGPAADGANRGDSSPPHGIPVVALYLTCR